MHRRPEFRIRPTGGWVLALGLLVLTVIFFVGALATWQDVDRVAASLVLALWVSSLVWAWMRLRTIHVSVRDGHLLWRDMNSWVKADEPIAGIARIVLASNGDLEVEFAGGRAPLRLNARKEYRADDLRDLARLLGSDSGHPVVEVDALPASSSTKR